MKFNYWFYLLLMVMVAYHGFILTQVINVNSHLTKLHGTVADMSGFGSRDDKRVRMKIKEYPNVDFLRSFYGLDRMFYNPVVTNEVVNDPHPELKRLPDSMLKVSFFVFNDQPLNSGKDVPYFYLKKEGESANSSAYYFNIFLYCKGKINFLSVMIFALCIVLIGLSIAADAPNMPDRFTFTLKGKFLLGLLLYNVLLVFI